MSEESFIRVQKFKGISRSMSIVLAKSVCIKFLLYVWKRLRMVKIVRNQICTTDCDINFKTITAAKADFTKYLKG